MNGEGGGGGVDFVVVDGRGFMMNVEERKEKRKYDMI